MAEVQWIRAEISRLDLSSGRRNYLVLADTVLLDIREIEEYHKDSGLPGTEPLDEANPLPARR
jgi:hypothetical protein